MAFSVEEFRKNFPILHKPSSRGEHVVYLDNAATTQKPQCVIDAVTDFYTNCNSNIHRGLYELAETATLRYENTRKKAAKYLNVDTDEIIFVRGTTEAINLVANCYVRKFLNADDEIIVGAAEHHSNYLQWQILEKEIGIKRKIAPLTETGEIDIDAFFKFFTRKTKFVAIQHSSNVLGTTNNISELTKIAHGNGAKILIDGASSLLHSTVDLKR
jgi:cysteine desulfurase/selenocysteine lyase